VLTNRQAGIRELGAPGDLGWVIMAHGEIYAREYGWDTTFEALVARIVADFAAGQTDASDPADPADGLGSAAGQNGAGELRQRGWIAEVDGVRAGCVLCCAADGDTAQLRVLLVTPQARGLGLGARLVDEAIGFARAAGFGRMKLWTNHPLTAARSIYQSRGFTLVAEEPHHSYGAELIGQVYELDLRAQPAVRSAG
jgi:GNAT superfamily N-acetyltransferase